MKTSALLALVFGAALIRAADYPAPVEGDWVVHDFRFHTGETMAELRLHYFTVGAPQRPAVLVLHGTNGTGRAVCVRISRGELFGPGQPLDASPISSSCRMHRGGKIVQAFGRTAHEISRYDYEDMVQAQYRLVKEHLGVDICG